MSHHQCQPKRHSSIDQRNYFQTSKVHMTWIIQKVNNIPMHCGVAYENVHSLARCHLIRVCLKGSYKYSSIKKKVPSIVSYRVNCVLCSCVTLTPFLGFPRWDSLAAMCYLTNQWITDDLPIDLINAQALSEAFIYMCLLDVHVNSLQSIQLTM